MRKTVLAITALPEDQLARIRAAHELIELDPARAPEAFHEALGRAHGLICVGHPVTAALLERAPKLEVVSSVSVGVDNYDHAALHRRGIRLCHTPGVLDNTVADTTFGLLIATARRFVEMARMVQDGNWTQVVGPSGFGVDVHGKTLGMVGFGRIGQAVARRGALGFGMPVLYHTRRPVDLATQAPDLVGHARHATRAELLEQSDFVVLMLPLSPSTRALANAEFFQAMKPGAIFINAGRGPTVDEAALLAALNSGQVGAAGLDVFAQEPLPADSPLRSHPRVTPLPHIGSATAQTRHGMAALATSNLLESLAGQRPNATFDTTSAG